MKKSCRLGSPFRTNLLRSLGLGLALAGTLAPAHGHSLRARAHPAAGGTLPFALSGGPSISLSLVRAADGSGETRFRIDDSTPRTTRTVAHHAGGMRKVFRSTLQSAALGTFELQTELDVVGPRAGGSLALRARITEVPVDLAVSSLGIELEVKDEAGRQSLLLPVFSGVEILEPATTIPGDRPFDTRHAQSTQASAYYSEDGKGLLLFAEDRAGTEPKHFVFSTGGNAQGSPVLRLALEFYLPDTDTGGRDAATPVAVAIQPYTFDARAMSGWYRAAKLYRGYVERTGRSPGGILERGRLEDRRDVPGWMKDLDVMVTERYGWRDDPNWKKTQDPLLALRRMQQRLDADNMLVTLWFWNQRNCRAPLGRTGTWLPHRETVRQIHALRPYGIRFLGYTFPAAFDIKNPLLAASGLYLHANENRAGRPQLADGPLEPRECWKDKTVPELTRLLYLDISSPALQLWYRLLGWYHAAYSGLSGFYSDLPMAVTFADFHRPAGEVGVTESAYRGYGRILEASQWGARDAGRDFVQCHEAAFEWLIRSATAGQGAVGTLARVYPGKANTRGVPFFQTVYSGYTSFWPADEGYGPQTLSVDLHAYGDPRESNMSRILAEGFTWGGVPNTSQLDLSTGRLNLELGLGEPFASMFAHHHGLLKDLIAIRRSARKWLVHGELLNSPVAAGDEIDMTVMQPSGRETYRKLAVPTTAWAAKDGSIRIVAANGSRTRHAVTIDLRRLGLAGAKLLDTRTFETFTPGASGRIVLAVDGGSGRLLEPIRS